MARFKKSDYLTTSQSSEIHRQLELIKEIGNPVKRQVETLEKIIVILNELPKPIIRAVINLLNDIYFWIY